MTPLNRAAQALHESLNTADISMNGDLATFAVIAVLKAAKPDPPETMAEDMVCDWIDTILNTPTGAET